MPESGLAKRDFASTFARGLAVIQAFGPGDAMLTLAEVAERTGVDRAVARRMLLTLAELGFVRVERRRFSLTAKVLRLGFSYLASNGTTAVAQSLLTGLAHHIREATSITVLDEHETVSIAHADSPERRMGFAMTPGVRLPIHASASGRLFLAAMADDRAREAIRQAPRKSLTRWTVTDPELLWQAVLGVRAAGHAVVVQELDEGLIAVAVPIRRDGTVTATLNVSSNLARAGPEEFAARVLPALRETAADLARAMG